MMRMARLTLGAVVVGLAVTVGCFFTNNLDDSLTGQGGATTSTGGTGGNPPCSTTLPCEDDKNPCTKDECKDGFCLHTPQTMARGPASTECITIACVNGASSTPTIHDGAACGMQLKCNAAGQCAGCMDVSACPMPPDCQAVFCVSTVCEVKSAPMDTLPKNVTNTPNDCKRPICDGNGGVTFAPDDGDKPLDDNNPCTDQACVMAAPMYPSSMMGAPCLLTTNASAKVCDGSGLCVECVAGAQCTTGMKPSCDMATHTCISCSDGKQNGGETGVDCGGTCPKCNGETCGTTGECKNNVCADGFCCDKDCSATCNACNVPGKAGQCTPVTKGLEDLGCTGAGNACSGVGACTGGIAKKKAGAICSDNNECYTDACNGVCRLPEFAPCAENGECASLRCLAKACTGCSLDTHCASNKCSMVTGRCLIAGGGVCSVDIDCAVMNCDNATHLCGKASGAGNVCNADADCSSRYCDGATTDCTSCTTAMQVANCASDVCKSGNCLLISGSPCTADGQCVTNKCSTAFPSKCQ